MNFLFLLLFLGGALALLFDAPERFLGVLIGGASDGVSFALRLLAIYSVWMIFLKLLERSGVTAALSRLFRPLLRRLFPGEKEEPLAAISLNLSANLIGAGGAATPAGLKAMETLEQKRNRVLLVVINATSIQLLPTTVLGLRAEWGGVSDIILPSLIATALTTAIGILLVKLLVR